MSIPAANQMGNAPALLSMNNPNQTTKILEKNGSIILTSLSLRQGKKRDGSVSIQVGNALFKVTRVPLEFCLSRLEAKDKKHVEALGPLVGANVTVAFDPDTITYIVSPDKLVTSKSLSAWALNVPNVTDGYIRALAERSNATDPLPNVDDYDPPGALGTLLESNENNASPAMRCRLLKGYKVLSMQVSDGEMMTRCTGATVVPLYKEGANGKVDLKFWQNDEYWAELMEKQKEDRLVIVWLECSSKKVKKGRDFLVKKMKLYQSAGYCKGN